MTSKDKGFRADASQFFIAGELCRRGLVAVVTMGNCPNTDILCSNREGTKFAHIQVKTFRPGKSRCIVGLKSKQDYGPNFFWVLGGIPEPGSDQAFRYFVIPSGVMAKNMQECFRLWDETPPHNPESKVRTVRLPPGKNYNGWSIDPYLDRWDLIEKCVETHRTS